MIGRWQKMAIEAQYKKLTGNQEEGWPSTLAYLQQQREVSLSPGVRPLSQRVSGVLDYELDRLGDWLGTPEFDRLLVEAIWGEEESVAEVMQEELSCPEELIDLAACRTEVRENGCGRIAMWRGHGIERLS